MIKEYEEVKLELDRHVSSHFLDAAVVVDEIFTDEYNALDIRIIGKSNIPTSFYLDTQYKFQKNYNRVINNFEMISGVTPNQTSILVYLKPVMEIRATKINKIKSNIIV